MKKRNFLLSGAVVLGTLLGVSAYSGVLSNVAPLADGDNTTETPAEPSNAAQVEYRQSTPANGAQVPLSQNLSRILINYAPNTEDPSNLGNRNLVVTITKDEEAYATITSEEKNFEFANDGIYINFPAPITETGVYTVTVPAGFFYLGYSTESSKDMENALTTITFTVKDEINWTAVSPAIGATVAKGGLNTYTITYPEGAVVTPAVGGPLPYVAEVNPAGSTGTVITEKSKYTVTAKDNVVTLTAETPDAITPLSQTMLRLWYGIFIPEGAWTVSYDGKNLPVIEHQIEKYSVAAFTAEWFKFKPAMNTETPISNADLKTIKLQSDVALAPAPGKTFKAGVTAIASLYLMENGTGKNVGSYLFESANDAGTVYTLTLKEPTSLTSIVNKNDLFISGKYYLTITAGTFAVKDSPTDKNALLTINNFNVKGVDQVLPVTETPNDGVATSGYKFKNAALTYGFKMVIANPDAEIVLRKGTEVLETVKAADAKGGIYATSAALTANGNTAVGFVFSKEYTEQGSYTVEVPEGAFKTLEGGTPNAAYTLHINNNPAFDNYTISPTPWNPETNETVSEISEVVWTYPEGTTLQINPLVDQGNVNVGVLTKEKAITGSAGSGNNTGRKFTIDGNKLILTFATPIKDAIIEYRVYGITLPNNFLIVTENGQSAPSVKMSAYYSITEPAKGSINLTKVKNPDDLKTVIYSAEQGIYLNSAVKGTLTNAEGKLFAEYTPAKIDGNGKALEYTTTTDLTEIPSGTYYFTLPLEAFSYQSSTVDMTDTTKIGFYNAVPYSFAIEVENPNTGVEAIEGDALLDIYGIDGRVVALKAEKSALLNLEPGLYIVNGQKLIIRK